MPFHTEREKQPNSVKISLGTLFTVRLFGKETERVDVITDPGRDNYFFSARIHEDKDGTYLTMGGTGGPENFGRVVGSMSIQEVIEAARLGARKMGYELTKKQLNSLKALARKGSRILLL